jgi:thiamine pyrophosphokinase
VLKIKRVIIIANGNLKNPAFYRDLIQNDDFIICVNGGSSHALAIGVRPDLLIGDLDSLPDQDRKNIMNANPELIEYPTEKDKSDLEIALNYALEMNPARIIIFGALGGKRADHAFINPPLLALALRKNIPAIMIDEIHEISLHDKSFIVDGKCGDILSLFALSEAVRSIRTEGLKYPLNNEEFFFPSTRGLSNELTGSRASVNFSSGLLLTVKVIRS